MATTEELFNAAAACVQNHVTNPKRGNKDMPDDKKMLELYGLFKVATIGRCTERQPGMFNLKAKAKWSAWNSVSDISKDEAMEKYIDKVQILFDWVPECKTTAQPTFGNSVSTLARHDEEVEEENIFGWAKDNKLEKLQKWLENGNNVNEQDKEGLTPLHWTVDRGHVEACQLLLKYGANPETPDNDGQTPLDYAITCEYEKIENLIKIKIEKSEDTN